MNDLISVLFIGDVVGDPGINFVRDNLQSLIEKYQANFVVINGENAANGKSITEKEADKLFSYGANVITTGNHVWDNWKSKPLLANNPLVLRPYNYPPGNVGRGFAYFAIDENIVFAVLNLQGRTFMQSIDCPFRSADHALKQITEKTNLILVDFHADATAEKMAMGHYLDGKVSALVGTHTHIQTSDACILPEGTAYITDSGMTGPYDSVVGMKKDIALRRFLFQIPFKFEIAEDNVRICGVNIIVDTKTGKALKIQSFTYPEPIREIV